MNRLLWPAVALMGVVGILGLATGRPDFTGDWVLNLARSRIARPGIHAGTVRIEHTGEMFSFARTFTTDDGEDAAHYVAFTDGKQRVDKSANQTRRVRMYWDGDRLVLDEVITMAGRTATNLVHYSLENGGRTLVARESFRGPILKYDNVWVFDRK